MSWAVRPDNLSGEASRALVSLHGRGMIENSPPDHCFALDSAGLQSPHILLLSAWRGGQLGAIGALRDPGDGTGEIKSVHAQPDALRQGAGGAILAAIIATA